MLQWLREPLPSSAAASSGTAMTRLPYLVQAATPAPAMQRCLTGRQARQLQQQPGQQEGQQCSVNAEEGGTFWNPLVWQALLS